VNPLCLAAVLLIAVGLYGVLLKRNLFKVLLGIVLMAMGVAAVVVTFSAGAAPVDAVSQTVGVIAIVSGASVASLMAVTAVRLYEKYGTMDIREMRRLKG